MATEEVSIDWPANCTDYFGLRVASDFGIDIKNWLLEQGLVMNTDFQWQVNTNSRTVDLTFFNQTHYATMAVLKFQGTL